MSVCYGVNLLAFVHWSSLWIPFIFGNFLVSQVLVLHLVKLLSTLFSTKFYCTKKMKKDGVKNLLRNDSHRNFDVLHNDKWKKLWVSNEFYSKSCE